MWLRHVEITMFVVDAEQHFCPGGGLGFLMEPIRNTHSTHNHFCMPEKINMVFNSAPPPRVCVCVCVTSKLSFKVDAYSLTLNISLNDVASRRKLYISRHLHTCGI